jgi:hypothetical protein
MHGSSTAPISVFPALRLHFQVKPQIAVALAGLFLVWTAPATAQSSPPQQDRIAADRVLREQEVTERKQEGYSPLSVRIGSFMLNPGFDVSGRYTDNLYSTPNDRKSDLYTILNPSLLVRSDFPVHEFEAWASSKVLRYKNYSGEDVENYDLYARAKIDVMRGSWFAFKPSYILDHETRSSPDAVSGGKEPIKTTAKGLDFEAEHKPARLLLRTDVAYIDRSFDDSRLADGLTVNNADRNREEINGGVRLGYELTPGYIGFVEGRANDRSYDNPIDDLGFRRDSSGYEARVGASIELTGKLKGDVFAGYMWQDYVDPRFRNIATPVVGTALRWNATTLTTVKLQVSRTVEETTVGNAAGYMQNAVEVGVDHELKRNIILSASGKVSDQDYRGIVRDDRLYEAKFKATYQMNRNYSAYTGYNYSARSSNTDSAEYHTNVVYVGIAALF